MTIGKGYEIVAGFKKATTWGTAVACGANDGIRILNEDITTTVEQVSDDSLNSTPYRQANDTGVQRNSGTFQVYGKYHGLDVLVAMALGQTNGAPVARKSGSGATVQYAYYNSYKLKDSLEGLFGTLAIDKQVAVHEYDSVKIRKLTIEGKAGDRVTFTFEVVGRKFSNDSTTNTSSTMANVTEPSPRKYIMFGDGKFFMKTQSAGAINGDDQIYPSEFSITIDNKLGDGDVTSLNYPYIDEPVREDFMEVTGTITLPRYEGTTEENAFINGTKMKMKFAFRGSAIGTGPYYYRFDIYMPQVQITDAGRKVAGAGKIGAPIEFVCTRADSAPDGMDGNGNMSDLANWANESRGVITNPIEIEIVNVWKTDPLA